VSRCVQSLQTTDCRERTRSIIPQRIDRTHHSGEFIGVGRDALQEATGAGLNYGDCQISDSDLENRDSFSLHVQSGNFNLQI